MNQELCTRRIIHQERLEQAHRQLPEEPVLRGMSELFKAMGESGRLRILMALEHQEMCVCDLAALLDTSESAASHQLRLLRTMRLVDNRRQGQVLYYRLVDEHVTQLVEVARLHVSEPPGQ